MEWIELSSKLSKRELECFCLVIHGKPGREIARNLGLSPRTIEEYYLNIKSKLQLQSINEVTDFAFQNNYISAMPEINEMISNMRID